MKNYDFEVALTCRHDGCTEQMKKNAIDEVKNLFKYHNHIVNAHITIDKQNSLSKVEIAIHVPGTIITGNNADHNEQKAFDDALEKVKIQLKKLREKITNHRAASVDVDVSTENE